MRGGTLPAAQRSAARQGTAQRARTRPRDRKCWRPGAFSGQTNAMPDHAPHDFSRIRAAVFDYGGVLLAGGPSDVVAFGARVGLPEDAWRPLRREFFGNDGIWARLERGEATYDEFTAELRRAVEAAGGRVSDEQAATFMGSHDPMGQAARLRPAMLEAVRRLRRCIPTALLTNNVREWRSGWKQVLQPETLFDVVIDSSEVGARKPEPRIYEITRERLDVPHDSIFFLDDIGQNLKAAKALGWTTVLHEDTDAVLAVLDRLAASVEARGPRSCEARGPHD